MLRLRDESRSTTDRGWSPSAAPHTRAKRCERRLLAIRFAVVPSLFAWFPGEFVFYLPPHVIGRHEFTDRTTQSQTHRLARKRHRSIQEQVYARPCVQRGPQWIRIRRVARRHEGLRRRTHHRASRDGQVHVRGRARSEWPYPGLRA